jgi:2-polyprenyl-6-hydroxyphenyl methylase/3-demethylubiquinone-9 3-methyltransferase
VKSDETRFAFGRNWKNFLSRSFDEKTIAVADDSLRELTGKSDLKGLSFLDIGCGSGLFSLSAWRLGARPLTSFDFDPESVTCCEDLRTGEGSPSEWSVAQGSVLDRAYLGTLGRFDVVYSWGVLHHTGSMWEAIGNAAELVNPGGLLCIAIYNKARAVGIYHDGRFGPSAAWVPLKRWFCKLPNVAQDAITTMALGFFGLVSLLRLRNPFKEAASFGGDRGMTLRTDIKDWLGGYPYEYADIEEIFTFLKERGFTLEMLRQHDGLRCNEFTFRAPA